jgi:hypothetical protein
MDDVHGPSSPSSDGRPAGAEMKNDRGVEMGNWNRSYKRRWRYNDYRRADSYRRFSKTPAAATIRRMARKLLKRITMFTVAIGFSLAIIRCCAYVVSLYASF